MSAPGPVLVPTRLQTELLLRCYQETDCDLCVRVAVHLAVHGEHVTYDCPCECVWDAHEDLGVCQAARGNPRSASSPNPPLRPQAWPLLPSNGLCGRGGGLTWALLFQGMGKSLKMRKSLGEQLIQSLRSLGIVRRTWLAQLPLARSLPPAPGPDQSPACPLLTASLQAQVMLSFQAYSTARCVLLEVQVPATLVQPGQSVVCGIILLMLTAFYT